MSESIAATYAYRTLVAETAASGGMLPRVAYLAVGSGITPYTLDDTGLENEFHRVPAAGVATGIVLAATGTVPGAEIVGSTIREIGVFAEDGTLMARRVVAAKELEPESSLDVELIFQY